MKRLLWVLLILLSAGVQARELAPTETFREGGYIADSTGYSVLAADSVCVTVTDSAGALVIDSVWYNAADAQCEVVNDKLFFADAWGDLNGAGGLGPYKVELYFWNDTYGLPQIVEIEVQETSLTLAQRADSLQAALDLLQGTLDVNVAQISGDATAADNFETMLDGSGGGVLSLGQLAIRASGADTALIIVGGGHGIFVTGGSNAGSDRALKMTTLASQGDVAEIAAKSGSGGTALILNGDPGGYGLFIQNASGTAAYLHGGAYGLQVDGDTGIWVSGTTADVIPDWTGSTDVTAITDTVNAIIDSIQNAATLSEIADVFTDSLLALLVADTGSGTLWSYLIAQVGTGSGTDTLEIKTMLEGLGFGDDSTFTGRLRLDKFYVITDADDTAGFYVANAGTAAAGHFNANSGSGFRTYSATGSGFHAESDGSNPAVFFKNDAGGNGLHLYSSNDNGLEIESDSSHAVYIHADSGNYSAILMRQFSVGVAPDSMTWAALDIRSDSGTAVNMVIANNTGYALQTEGTSYIHPRDTDTRAALLLVGVNGSPAVYAYSDSGYAMRLSKSDATGSKGDTTIWIAGTLHITSDLSVGDDVGIAGSMRVTDSIIAADIGSVTASVSLSSSDAAEIADSTFNRFKDYGPHGVVYYVIDTSGTDDTLSGVWLSGRTLADNVPYTQNYTINGHATLGLTADSMVVTAFMGGYTFTPDTVAATGVDTLSILGYNWTSDLAQVYGYLSDLGAGWSGYAMVEATLSSDRPIDTCNGSLVYERRKVVYTSGSNGYFTMDLLPSACLSGEKYHITVSMVGREDVELDLEVPNEASYQITWEE